MLEENRFENMLASLRVRKGWTQEDAAAHIGKGMSRHTYSDLETGKLPPSPKHLKLLAAGFKLNQEDTDALYYAAHHGSPRIHNLPFDRNLLFTGRDTYLEQLDELFKAGNRVALTGLAGIGKTQLALEYAYCCFPNVFRAVLWVNAANKTTLEQSYDELAQKLELPELNEQELYKRVQAVKQYLEDHTNWLLIMDNADDLPLARSFFPKAHHGRILLTTRTQMVGSIVRKINIGKMEQEEGLLFLLRRSGELQGDAALDDVSADIREAASQVVELLDGHPLALDQAGAYIEEGVSFTEYIKLYEEERNDLLRKRGSLKGKDCDYPDTVVVTFELCFRKASEQHPLSRDILHFCSFLHPDAIPDELFQHDGSFNSDTTAFRDGRTALLRYSLIKRNTQEQTLSLHRLVQAVLVDTMSFDLQKQWRERVVRALNANFSEVYLKDLFVPGDRLLSHVLACSACSEDELTPTVVVASLFHMAVVYLNLYRQYSEAVTLQSKVLSICKQRLGIEHPETATALNNLAFLYMQQGNYEQAEQLLIQAFSIRENHFKTKHPDTAKSLYNLAFLYLTQGKFEQAEPLLLQALSIQVRHLGTEHPDTANSLHRLASIYSKQGQYEQAEQLLQQAIVIQVNSLGTENFQIVVSLFDLVTLLHVQGKHEQAEALNQRALSILEAAKGESHQYIQKTKKTYAEILHSIGRDAEAAVLEVNDEPSV